MKTTMTYTRMTRSIAIKKTKNSPGKMRDIKNSIDVGDVERNLGCDISPGLGRRVSVQEMQTGQVRCLTFTKRTHTRGEEGQQ